MSEDQFAEFKDYLDYKLEPISSKIDKIDKRLIRLESRVDSGFDTLTDAITDFNDHIDKNDNEHKTMRKRIRKLEKVAF